jgi:hypothetical protein
MDGGIGVYTRDGGSVRMKPQQRETPKARAVRRMKVAALKAIKHMPAGKLDILAFTVTVHAWGSAKGKAKEALYQEIKPKKKVAA